MLERLESIEKRYEELTNIMGQPEVALDFEKMQNLARERSSLEEVVTRYREYKATVKNFENTQALLQQELDEEMANLAKEELEDLRKKRELLLEEIKFALLPKDPADAKSVIMEIRAGTGGGEGGPFFAPPFPPYSPFSPSQRWGGEKMRLGSMVRLKKS